MEGVVLQVALQRPGQRQQLGPPAAPVDGEAAEVLQRGEEMRPMQGVSQPQRHPAVCLALSLGLPPVHVVLDQAEDVREGVQAGKSRRHRVQPEGATAVLHAHAGGPAAGVDRQRQQVARVAAVAEQERALRLLEESLASLSHGDGAPVPACETERSEGQEVRRSEGALTPRCRCSRT